MAKLTIVLPEGFADWEYSLLCAAARMTLSDQVQYATVGGAEVTSLGGLRAHPDLAVEAWVPEQADALILIGSPLWQEAKSPNLNAQLQAAVQAGLVVGGICGATLPLARAGLFNTRKHTSNALVFLRQFAKGYEGQALYVDQPQAVSEQRVVSAPGSAPATFAAEVLKLLHPDRLPAIAEFKALVAREHLAKGPEL